MPRLPILSFVICFLVAVSFGMGATTEPPKNEGADFSFQLPTSDSSGNDFDAYVIIGSPIFQTDTSIQGTAIDTVAGAVTSQDLSSYNSLTGLFNYTCTNQDWFGNIIIEWRGVLASHGLDDVNNTVLNNGDYFIIPVTSTNDDPIIKSGQASPSNSADSVTYSVNEGTSFVCFLGADDVDGDTVSYTLSGTDAGFFEIDSQTNSLNYISTSGFDFELPLDNGNNNTYSVTVTADDGAAQSNSTDSQAITINVMNVNENPIIQQGDDPIEVTIDEDQVPTSWTAATTANGFPLSAVDPDAGSTLTWSISTPAVNGLASIDGNGFVTYTPDADMHGTNLNTPTAGEVENADRFTVRITDNGNPAKTDEIEFRVLINPINDDPPSIVQESSITINENDTNPIALTVIDYDVGFTENWEKAGGADVNKFNIDPATGALTIPSPDDLNYENPGSDNNYTLTVRVTDDTGLTDTLDVYIIIQDVNEAPVIDQGDAALNLTMDEDGTPTPWTSPTITASDEDDSSLEWGQLQWSIVTQASNGTATVVDPSANPPVFTYTPNAEYSGTDSFVVKVRDSDGGAEGFSDTIQVNVNVRPSDDPPIFTSFDGNASTSQVSDENVQGAFVFSAYDIDGGDISYSIHSGNDKEFFVIDQTSGLLVFDSSLVPDFEDPQDHDLSNTYEVTVAASDANGSSLQSLLVTIENVSEAAFFQSASTFSANENQTAVGQVVVSDTDYGDTHTFEIRPQQYQDDAGKFQIDANTGVLSFLTAPDFEANGSADGSNNYNLIIRAIDSGNAHSDQNVTVQVLDDNDRPDLFTGVSNPTSITILESLVVESIIADLNASDQDSTQTHTWALSGDDASFFEVVPTTGELELAVELDFENPSSANGDNIYELTFNATDSHNSPLTSSSFNLQVVVENVNEPPFLTGTYSTSITMQEDNASSFISPSWQAIDPETNSSNGISWFLVDEDGTKVTQLTTADTGSTVRIDDSDGLLTFLPVDNANRYAFGADSFIVGFEDAGGLEDNVTMTVRIDPVNDLPEISGISSQVVTMIDHPEGSYAVVVYNASDPHDFFGDNSYNYEYTADSYLNWSLSGDDAELFELSSGNSGTTLRFKTKPVYDGLNALNNRYDVDILVADEYGGVTSYAHVINVTNSPEPPELITTLTTVTISEDEDPTTWESVWGGVVVEDPDSGNLSWAISGPASLGTASVEENTGEIDYIPAADRFGDDNFTVTVNDGDFDLNFTINVRIVQVNDPPEISDTNSTGHPGEQIIWFENTPTATVIRTFDANDSRDSEVSQSLDYSSSNYSWSLGGNDRNQFRLDIYGNLSFVRVPDYESPNDADVDNVYDLVIKATDNSVDFSEYPISVRVTNVNDPPEFTSFGGLETANIELAENENFVGYVLAEATEEDSVEITYEIIDGMDKDLFLLNEFTGELSFLSAPNYENRLDADTDNVYVVEINATDNLSSATQVLRIEILDVNENPSFDLLSVTHNESEAGFSLDVSNYVLDEDLSPNYVYSLNSADSPDNLFFTIDSESGILTFRDSYIPDYENKLDENEDNVFEIIFSIADGDVVIQGAVNLEIIDQNDPPSIDGTGLTEISLPENTLFVKTLVASDQDMQNSFNDLLIVVDDESVGLITNEETTTPSFSGLQSISSSQGSSFTMSGDFDRDGDLDAILLQKDQGKVSLLENDGTGTFQTPVDIYVIASSDPTYGAVGDFNEDGFPDLAIAMQGSGEVIVFQNNAVSEISFTQINNIAGVDSVSKLDLGDVDSDGDQDIILIYNQNQISWFSNEGPLSWHANASGNVSFSPGADLSFDMLEVNRPQSLTLGDADQDGDMDLAVASSQDGNFSLFLNDGNGSFSSPSLLYKEFDGEAHGIDFLDLNQDGLLDLVLSTKSPSKFGVMLQKVGGAGEFQTPSFFYNSSYFVNSFDFGDMDLDGDLDLIAATSADSKLRWFINDGNGQFSLSDQYILTDQESIVSIAVGDFSQSNALLEFSVVTDYRDGDKFVFRPQFSGNLFFKENPDFENINDEGQDYQFDLKVTVTDKNSDPLAETTRKLVVNVENVWEAPVITEPTAGEGLQLRISEHTTFVIDVNSTNDEDLYENTYYSISGGADAALFEIDEISGELNFIEGPDFENPMDSENRGFNSYDVVVRATDDGPETSFSDRVLAIQVLDDNDLPEFNPDPFATMINLLEDQNVTLELSDLNATDPEGASLSWTVVEEPANGTYSLELTSLFYKPDVDFNGSDTITLQVEDNASLTARLSLEFLVEQVNDSPVITTLEEILHPENEINIITLEADDVEMDILTWELVGGLDANRFQLAKNGMLSFLDSAPDFETPDSNSSNSFYNFIATVSDGNATAEGNFTIQITDVPDIAPEVSNLDSNASTLIEVLENQLFVIDLDAEDVEGDELVLTLSGGSDKGLFNLDQTGSLTFKSAPDFENPSDGNGDNFYIVDVNVTDGLNAVKRSLLIKVLNDNEMAPQITQNLGSLSSPVLHPENETLVTTLEVIDDTNESITFSLVGGLDQDKFDLNSSSGQLKFKSEFTPDFEGDGSFDGDNIFHIIINVSDGLLDSTADFYLGISDVNEPPVLTRNSFEVLEDQPQDLLIEVFDPEDDPFRWEFLRSPDHGTLTSIEGGYRYQPDNNYYGSDNIQFIAIDDQNTSYELNASIVIIPQNDDPTAENDSYDFERASMDSLTIDALSNDSSFPDEGESLEITNWTEKKNSMLTFDEVSQTFIFTPTSDYIGPFEFTYTLFDGERFSMATVNVNVSSRERSSIDSDPWRYIANFGYFTENNYPWILHSQIGWVYVSEPGGENSVTWMWNDDLGWFWTGRDYFPYFFAEDTKRWYTWNGGIYDPAGVLIYDFIIEDYIGIEDLQKQRVENVVDSLSGNVQGLIDFVSSSNYFSSSEKNEILYQLYSSGQSTLLQNLIN